MGWEERNGKSYYNRKERDGYGVRSVYVGWGDTAQLIAQLDGIRQGAPHLRF
jgi:hypothetical protein